MKNINDVKIEIDNLATQVKLLTEQEDLYLHVKKKMPMYRGAMAFGIFTIWLTSYITKVHLKADLYVPYWEMFLTMLMFFSWIFSEVRLITYAYMRMQTSNQIIQHALNRLNENLETLNKLE